MKRLPNEDWWIKSDGCDIVAGLTESMRLEWGGDVDLGDRKLQQHYKTYLSRLTLAKGIVRDLNDSNQRNSTISDLINI